MRNLLVLWLLFPLNTIAEPLSGEAGEFVYAVQNLVKTERVVVEGARVGLLIPAKEMLSGSGGLMDSGRRVLEKAGSFAKQSGKKLIILVPDEREHKDFRPVAYSVHGGQARRNAFVGPYVYVLLTQD